MLVRDRAGQPIRASILDWEYVLDTTHPAALPFLYLSAMRLVAYGFDFVKLDAQVFLEGMPLAPGMVPSNDICRHLAGLGLTLIVGGIADEGQLARVFGFGVLFGQGQLFGGPRPVRVQVAARASHRRHGARRSSDRLVPEPSLRSGSREMSPGQ